MSRQCTSSRNTCRKTAITSARNFPKKRARFITANPSQGRFTERLRPKKHRNFGKKESTIAEYHGRRSPTHSFSAGGSGAVPDGIYGRSSANRRVIADPDKALEPAFGCGNPSGFSGAAPGRPPPRMSTGFPPVPNRRSASGKLAVAFVRIADFCQYGLNGREGSA